MDLAELSRNTATWLLVGSLGEGMPIMLFGGFAAHRGWLALIPWVNSPRVSKATARAMSVRQKNPHAADSGP